MCVYIYNVYSQFGRLRRRGGLPDLAEHDHRVRTPRHGTVEPRDVRDRLDPDHQQSDRGEFPDRARTNRRIRGPRVRVGHRVQRRVFPDAAHGPTRRLHRAGRVVRVPIRVVAQLRADGRGRVVGYRRVVRADPRVRARESRVAGVPG